MRRNGVRRALRPLRHGPFLELSVDLDVDSLVEEGDTSPDPVDVAARLRIEPGDALALLAGVAQGPVAGPALVGAARACLTWPQQIHPHVCRRQVPASRQAGLEQRQ